MDATTFILGGLALRAPITAGTNLLLAVQCGAYSARLRGGDSIRRTEWQRFFAALAVSTLAGAPKHAFALYADWPAYTAVVLTSNLAAVLSTYFAQRAVLASGGVAPPARRRLDVWFTAQLIGASALVLGSGSFLPVAINSALGLSIALWIEASAWRRGRGSASGWVVAGLAAGFLPGFVYLLKVPAGPSFDYNDLGHLFMIAGLAAVYRGTSRLRKVRAERRSPRGISH